jgi:hypothetical protein
MYAYICALMKKILFYITIALAAFLLPKPFCTQGAISELGFKIVQDTNGFATQSNHQNIVFDTCFEEFSEDDESDDSERKKDSSLQYIAKNTSFLVQKYSKNFLEKVLTAHLFFPRKTALFIFLCVFRL